MYCPQMNDEERQLALQAAPAALAAECWLYSPPYRFAFSLQRFYVDSLVAPYAKRVNLF